jgi:molecular chaperone IbpA
MRHFDLSPLYRSTVGFDRLFTLLNNAPSLETSPTYPPYNIERRGENDYRITIAVAGFSEAELSIESKENTLVVRGSKEVPSDPNARTTDRKTEILHQGIAGRAFERHFQLADHVYPTGASLEHGLLHINLVREVPEAQKPRQIPIGGTKTLEPKVVEARQAA